MLHALRVGIASHAACGMLSVIHLFAYQPPEQSTVKYDGIREVDMLTVYRLYWYMMLGLQDRTRSLWARSVPPSVTDLRETRSHCGFVVLA